MDITTAFCRKCETTDIGQGKKCRHCGSLIEFMYQLNVKIPPPYIAKGTLIRVFDGAEGNRGSHVYPFMEFEGDKVCIIPAYGDSIVRYSHYVLIDPKEVDPNIVK